MYDDQEEFWDDFGWLAEDATAHPAITSAMGSEAWRTDNGAALHAKYKAMGSTAQDEADAAIDLSTQADKVKVLVKVFGVPADYADATTLKGQVGWEAYAGWFRRHDGTDWRYARSTRTSDTWMTQDQMVAAVAPPKKVDETVPQTKSDVYADATSLKGEVGWEAYADWYRRHDGTDWRYARTTKMAGPWMTQAEMIAAMTPQQQVSTLPDTVPDAMFDATAELTDAQIDEIISSVPEIQVIVDQLLEQATASVAASAAVAAVEDLDDEEINELVDAVTVGETP